MKPSRQELEDKAARLWRTSRARGALRPAAFAATARQESRVVVPDGASMPRQRTAERLQFSIMFFSAAASEVPRPRLYRLVHEAARFADANGFSAIWLPERHFHAFGGPYPNPAVLAASLASITDNVRLRAGSVVLPLHHPAEVVEAWSMVDNLSAGRVEIAFGSGWNPNDFVLSPATYGDAKGVMKQRIEEVRRLWRGEALELANGRGEKASTRVYPAPLQAELPIWISATGTPETFAWAGSSGFNILTMLLGGSIDDIQPKIALYREARRTAGLDPDGGKVALMLHSFVHADGDYARSQVRGPFMDYVRSSVDVQRHGSAEGRAMTEAQREQLVAYAFERYTRSAALFGSPEECRALLDRAAAAGVDEIACLVDFGVDEDRVLEALKHLDAMRPVRRSVVAPPAAVSPVEARNSAAAESEPIAVIGMSALFPGASDLGTFWENLRQGRETLTAPPTGRGGAGMPPRGGFLEDIESFDAGLFGLAPAEARAMDPHQRVFLEQVWAALEDAGCRPSALRGRDTGVFAAVYSNSFETSLRESGKALDGLAVAGAVLSMVPNRTSFVFDWTGPSETINTACSSGLVAVHRAVSALRGRECSMAVAGGVSLLLAPEETAALARMGILSPTGTCRAFDRHADGQVRGEGAGVLVLKRLSDAEREGDFVYAVIRGTAVNHGGARANSLTLPNPRLQAACMSDAIRRSGVDPRRLGYIEAHGAGTAIGDLAELSAFEQAFATLDERPSASCPIGSVKSNIGSLDAAGGIAGLIKTVLALHHRCIPPTLNRAEDPEGFDSRGPLRFADRRASWPAPEIGGARAAGVHAYGLGGTNAHIVLEEYSDRRPPTQSAPQPTTVSLSARSDAALKRTAARLLAWLDGQEEPPNLGDLAHTLAVGRESLPCLWRATVPTVAALRTALREWIATGALPQQIGASPSPGRRIPVPGHAFERPQKSVVGAFYDFVTQAEERSGEIYLTLAPLPQIVPGFSWTRTFQSPERHPEHWKMLQEAQREMRDVMFSGVDLAAVKRVLDFGCGIGTDLVALAQRYRGLQGTGVTISARQAAIARARIAEAGLTDRLTVHQGDSAHDAFPGMYDLVIGFEVAHHIADKEALFGNIAGHLMPEGALLLADCAANTVAPINLPEVGSFTSTKQEYAELLARHGLMVTECVDLSREIANFLHDPDLEAMIAEEASRGGGDVGLMSAVQRSWDGFGKALRSGLISYLLVTARRRPHAPDLVEINRQQLGIA
jgi:natural product biosynthesis luciferase-like monooxygenase protein